MLLVPVIRHNFQVALVVFLTFKDGRTNECLKTNEYDYIVVGAGSSGAVVAARLSEESDVTVLLLEAGGEPLPISDIPLYAFETTRTEMNWNLTTQPQQHCCGIYSNQRVPLPRGKVLGGTSSVNFMTYTRGNKQDYDAWAELGNEGWGYEDVLPYFYKIEDYKAPRSKSDDKHHKTGGPITIEYPAYKTPLAQAFLDAGQEVGSHLVDYNTDENIGFMYPPVNTKNGARCSSYVGYLKPHSGRPNLRIETHSLVTKKAATGVEYEKNQVKCTVKARREVIVSAGAYKSPQLLMLSGIGPKEHLETFQIPMISDLPGVGQNAQDHVVASSCSVLINQTIGYNFKRFNTAENLELWQKSRTGPMTTPTGVEGVAFIATPLSDNQDWPDMEIYLINDNVKRIFAPFIRTIIALALPNDETDILNFFPILLRPKSRGTVMLQSADPHDSPLIDPNYLSHPDDLDVMVQGTRFARKLIQTHAFQKYGASLVMHGLVPSCILNWLDEEEYLKCGVRYVSSSGYHPSSTCKMGPSTDPMSVVDERLRVYGVKRLRVADASIMPNIVAAHPSAACMMIGEKVADMIKEDWKWQKGPEHLSPKPSIST